MEKSLFSDIIAKYFSGVVGQVVEKENNRPAGSQPLYHQELLREDYSINLQWGSSSVNQSIVAADVVEMDSSTPIKKREIVRIARGDIPKIGMKYVRGERDLSELQLLQRSGGNEAKLASLLMKDAAHAIRGVQIRKEIMLLQGLSTGHILLDDPEDPSLGIRVDFGYVAANQHQPDVPWFEVKATPVDDLRNLFEAASTKGYRIASLMMDRWAFRQLCSSQQGRVLVAGYNGQVVTDPKLLQQAGKAQMVEALKDEFGISGVRVVDSHFQIERTDGSKKTITPWRRGMVVGLPGEQVGRLVYGDLAEEGSPVEGVQYTKAGTHTLISMYRTTDPLKEVTAAQALCLPVIDGADGIFTLDAANAKRYPISIEDGDRRLEFEKKGGKITVKVEGSLVDTTIDEDWATAKIGEGSVEVAVEKNDTGNARSGLLTLRGAQQDELEIRIEQS